MFQILQDKGYSFEILRHLSAARYGGSDIVEILEVAAKLESDNFETWYTGFHKLAQRIESQAEAIDPARHRVSASNAWFRAATYYRACQFYMHGTSSYPRIDQAWDKQAAAFDKALELMDRPGRKLKIPTEHGFDVLGIFFPGAGNPAGQKPTIIAVTGFDGSMEESLHHVGFAGIERGYNVITYEGPGQPTVLRQQKKGFIHDWEKVVTPIFDYLIQRPDVDDSRIGLMGESLGGYLAVRAAAFEHRLAGVVAFDGIWDFHTTLVAFGEREKVDEELHHMMNQKSLPTAIHWMIDQGLWNFQIDSPYDWIQMTKPMELEGVIDMVQCPVWAGEAAEDIFSDGQPKPVVDALGNKATYVVLTDADAAGRHCHIGAMTFLN
ncbi:hypothetical protein N7493_002513 [Penicillium malachiteum]|uniref:Uncharacterized protein n=1 Tax=Penicillium malachiteum TaxID=1324776 RepID=A0AAD6HSP5_9EURO|nr:hypothetical protein N7493_002513 [Penicillium malachiteum]